MFIGFVQLGSSIPVRALIRNSSGVPTEPGATPTYRVYGPEGLMASGTGSLAKLDTGAITGATNASPIVITSASHGLNTGVKVTITGVGGNTAANESWTITRVSANTFSLDGSTGNGSYTSGGTWSVTGLYAADVTASSVNGYEVGETYMVLVSAQISSIGWGETYEFTVS